MGRAPETSVLMPTYVPPVVAATQSLPAQPVHRSKPGTPVNVDRLASFLRFHPEKSFSCYIIDGMRFGFDIGFPISAAPCAMVHSPNHPSAFKNSAFVSDYLTSKCAAGLFSSPPFCAMHISGLGVVPKDNGKLRLIHDLSSPTGVNVNDGISCDQFSPTYATIDMAISAIMRKGPRSFLTKVDTRNAFRFVPCTSQ